MNPKGRKRPKLKIRIPTPKPTRFHSTPKGEKGTIGNGSNGEIGIFEESAKAMGNRKDHLSFPCLSGGGERRIRVIQP